MTTVEFGGFYEREYRAVVGLAYVLTGDQAIAEDLVHEAFLAAWRRWGQVASYDRPDAWVGRVVVNLARSRWRRLRSEARLRLRFASDGSGPDVDLLPESESLWAEVRRLPRRQAQVLALYYAEDRPVADVAAVLGVAEGTVRALLHQGRQTLSDRLGGEL